MSGPLRADRDGCGRGHDGNCGGVFSGAAPGTLARDHHSGEEQLTAPDAPRLAPFESPRQASARTASRESGRTPKNPIPGPDVPRGSGDKVLRRREESRKKLAETEKRDAEA